MLSFIHYVSAVRRLEEIEKTILLMGGSRHHDRDVPVTLVAQRDMVKREIEYYQDKCETLGLLIFIFSIIGTMAYVGYWKFHG
jgi:hypothetical protein